MTSQATMGLEKALQAFRSDVPPIYRGISALSRATGISRPTIYRWLKLGYVADGDRCPVIVREVNRMYEARGMEARLTLHELRPDLWEPEKETVGE